MKKIIQKLFNKNRKDIWGYFNIFYLGIVVVFGGILLYEFIKLLIEQYTFLRAFGAFVFFTGVYMFGLFQGKRRRLKKIYSTLLSTFDRTRPYIDLLEKKKDIIFYANFFIFFLVFLYSFLFQPSILFTYVTYIFFGVFILYSILGGTVELRIEKISFSQNTFLKILIVSVSFFMICTSTIIKTYGIVEDKNIILLVSSCFYIIGFTYFFSDIFTNISGYFHSGGFKKLMISNTYNILSFSFIIITVLLLLGKFGLLESTKEKIIMYFESPSSEVEVTEEIPEIEENIAPDEEGITSSFIEKPISDIFVFDGFSALGSTGPEVVKLQEALRLIGSYVGEVSGDYDEATKQALTETLVAQCDWPETTRGIFGPLAQECISSVSVQFDITDQEADTGAVTNDVSKQKISNEAVALPLNDN